MKTMRQITRKSIITRQQISTCEIKLEKVQVLCKHKMFKTIKCYLTVTIIFTMKYKTKNCIC